MLIVLLIFTNKNKQKQTKTNKMTTSQINKIRVQLNRLTTILTGSEKTKVKKGRRIREAIDSDTQTELEQLMDETFGSMRGADPQDVFYDYDYDDDGTLRVQVYAFAGAEEKQQIKNVKTFISKAKTVDGVQTVTASEWEGDGTEETPYYLEITVTVGEATNTGKTPVQILAKKMFDDSPASISPASIIAYDKPNAYTDVIVLSYAKLKTSFAVANAFKQAALKIQGVTDVKIAELKSKFFDGDQDGNGFVQIIITKSK